MLRGSQVIYPILVYDIERLYAASLEAVCATWDIFFWLKNILVIKAV